MRHRRPRAGQGRPFDAGVPGAARFRSRRTWEHWPFSLGLNGMNAHLAGNVSCSASSHAMAPPGTRANMRKGRGSTCLADRAVRSDEMFERFTDRARRVVVLAQEEARMLNHNYIGTEHILLGLI